MFSRIDVSHVGTVPGAGLLRIMTIGNDCLTMPRLWCLVLLLTIFLIGCGTNSALDPNIFPKSLSCNMAYDEVRHISAPYRFNRYFCDLSPVCPAKPCTEYSCWAQASSLIYDLRFDYEDNLQSYRIGNVQNKMKVEFGEIIKLCE